MMETILFTGTGQEVADQIQGTLDDLRAETTGNGNEAFYIRSLSITGNEQHMCAIMVTEITQVC